MPRSVRIEYPGAFYHVMARGNRREKIFLDEEDRQFFLQTLSEACGMTGWRVHAWVLMGNHYHLFIETPEGHLVAGMQWLQNTYTRRFNTRHRGWGRLFGDRFKAVLVEGKGYYYQTLLDYLHLNPVRAGLIRPAAGQSVLDYPWSSVAGGHALTPTRRPEWLATADALGAFDLPDTVAGRRKFVARLDRRGAEEEQERCGTVARSAEEDGRGSHLRRGWYWGSQAFAERMLRLGAATLGQKRHRTYRASQEVRAHGEAEAQRLLTEGLIAAGLSAAELKTLSGSEARKVAIARLIKERTTMKLPWIAAQLELRSAANASQQIRRQKLNPPTLPKPLQQWLTLSRKVA
jgi:REP element-mobilizing transposase RayT